MKKFTGAEKPKKSEKIITLDKSIKNAIDESITVQGETSLEGKDKLIKQFKTFIDICNLEQDRKVIEQLKAELKSSNLSFTKMDQRIDFLTEQIGELDIVPTIEDVFSSEDYTKNEEYYILEKLDHIPTEKYNEYLNETEINNFFDKGNTIILKEGKGWELYFEPNKSNYYGDFQDIWRGFIIENKNFISDFIKSSCELVGVKNIRIDARVII